MVSKREKLCRWIVSFLIVGVLSASVLCMLGVFKHGLFSYAFEQASRDELVSVLFHMAFSLFGAFLSGLMIYRVFTGPPVIGVGRWILRKSYCGVEPGAHGLGATTPNGHTYIVFMDEYANSVTVKPAVVADDTSGIFERVR